MRARKNPSGYLGPGNYLGPDPSWATPPGKQGCWSIGCGGLVQNPGQKKPPRVVCAWCGVVLREGSEPVSHGICEVCAKKVLPQQKKQKNPSRPKSRRFLINAAVIGSGAWGVYSYEPATVADLAAFVEEGGFSSAIGYQATADAIERWTGIRVPVTRITFAMEPGDEAMVVRLNYRVADPRLKHFEEPSQGDWEIGLLKRLE